jgi:hypothetical protein
MGLTLVALFAMSALFAGSAFATAKLTLKAGGVPLVKGDQVFASSPGLTFTTAAGKLECTTNTINGSVLTNKAATDKGLVEEGGSINKGEEEFGGKKELCKTTTGLGPTEIGTHNWNWQILFKNKCSVAFKCTAGVDGENIVKSINATVKKVEFSSVFPAAGGAECWFASGAVKSKFPLNSASVTLTTNEQKFTLNKTKSNAACPKEGKLNGTWTTESGGKALESENK